MPGHRHHCWLGGLCPCPAVSQEGACPGCREPGTLWTRALHVGAASPGAHVLLLPETQTLANSCLPRQGPSLASCRLGREQTLSLCTCSVTHSFPCTKPRAPHAVRAAVCLAGPTGRRELVSQARPGKCLFLPGFVLILTQQTSATYREQVVCLVRRRRLLREKLSWDLLLHSPRPACLRMRTLRHGHGS